MFLAHFRLWFQICWTSDFAQIPLPSQFTLGFFVCTIICKFCVVSPFCVNTYPYRMSYVIHKLQSLSRVGIHLGTHVHPIVEGMCKEALEEIKVLVEGQVSRTPDAKIFAITLNANKTFLAHHLFNENGKGLMEILQGEKLDKVMDKFQPFYSPNIQNLVVTFKHNVGTQGPMDNILFLKSKSPYDYIQDSCFLGQMAGQKLFLFKMLLYGLASKANLVRCMQLGGDL